MTFFFLSFFFALPCSIEFITYGGVEWNDRDALFMIDVPLREDKGKKKKSRV